MGVIMHAFSPERYQSKMLQTNTDRKLRIQKSVIDIIKINITFSGLCCPGPGFCVESPGMKFRPFIEYAGARPLNLSGDVTLYVPGPGV